MTFRALRERRGLNQAQLAGLIGVSQTTISDFDLGRTRSPRFITLTALATALGTTPQAVAAAIEKSWRKAQKAAA